MCTVFSVPVQHEENMEYKPTIKKQVLNQL